MQCPICKAETSAPWPVTLPSGKVVDGCFECFEGQAADEWWRCFNMLAAAEAAGGE